MSKKGFMLRGAVFGAVLSGAIAFIFMVGAQMLAGSFVFNFLYLGERWLYLATIIPFIVTFAWLGGYFFEKTQLNAKTLWKISLMSTFFLLLYSGTIGTLFGEAIVRGEFETINVSGTLGWGVIYTFILTPFFTPITLLLINVFTELVLKLDTYNEKS